VQNPPRGPERPLTTSELALLLVDLDGVPDNLAAAHVDDGRGYCRGCLLPQTAPSVWPCTLAVAAREARALDRARRLPRPQQRG
jgi:hypothetical protein